ncbi:MAG: hypothetical protein QOF76_4266 [Solirubrobacteraceae bacterium]|jgi:L-2-hydroxyglutarate oxidase LhgO|nr:hypothetical protein [Solirubrobacteraceae bacterium]
MAKKEKKPKGKKATGKPADALRDAVERTFQGASDLPAGAQKRLQDVVDEFGSALTKLREQFDEKRLIETLENLRDQVETLGRRVQALERDPRKIADDVRARATGKKPAARRAAKPSAKKPAASRTRSAVAKKAAAKKPAAKRKPAAKKPAAKRKAAAKRKPAAKKAAAKKPAASS